MRKKVLIIAIVALFLGCLGLFTNRAVMPVWRVLQGQERAVAVVNNRPILLKDVLVYQRVEAIIATKDLSQNKAFNKYLLMDLLYREAKTRNLQLPDSFSTYVRDSVSKDRTQLEKNLLRSKLLKLQLRELDLTEDEFWHYVALYRTKQAYVIALRQSFYPTLVEPAKRQQDEQRVNTKFEKLIQELKAKSDIKIIDSRFKLEK